MFNTLHAGNNAFTLRPISSITVDHNRSSIMVLQLWFEMLLLYMKILFCYIGDSTV